MSVEVVHDQNNHFRLRVAAVDQVSKSDRPVHGGATFGDRRVTPASKRFRKHEDVGGPIAFVFVVYPPWVSWLDRNRRSRFFEQLHRHLIHAHHRRSQVTRPLVDVKNVFHPRHILAVVSRRNHPRNLSVRLERVFLRAFRTVSWLTASTTSRRTNSSASKCKVHDALPVGGLP